MKDKRTVRQMSETFGLDSQEGWGLEPLRSLFAAPRVFEPLLAAMDARHRGVASGVARIVDLGFADEQEPVVIDTIGRKTAERQSRPVAAYRITAKGSRLAEDAAYDIRIMRDMFPSASMHTLSRIGALLESMRQASRTRARFFSVARATSVSGLEGRHMRMWMIRLSEEGLVARSKHDIKDVVEVIPRHWRPNNLLLAQLRSLRHEPSLRHVSHELSSMLSGRPRTLPAITVDPLSFSGSTDYEHDVQAQRVMAALMKDSTRVPVDARVRMEPLFSIPARRAGSLGIAVSPGKDADITMRYQPDAEFREVVSGAPGRSVLEYERSQTRSDAWTHMERFCAWMKAYSFPFEEGRLRFVVDSTRRVEVYADTARRFREHADRNPGLFPPNRIEILVSASKSLSAAEDPFSPDLWRSVSFKGRGDSEVIVHSDPHSLLGGYANA